MSAQLLSSKIVVQEAPPSVRGINGVPTGVTAFPGIAAKGPVGVSTLLTSFNEFVRTFGGDTPNGYAASVARAFFDNGGQRLYFTRVVHYSDITEPTSNTSVAGSLTLNSAAAVAAAAQITGTITGPFALTTGDTLVIDRDAAGTATATFTAVPAVQASTTAGPYTLANNQTILLKINGGLQQTITFITSQFVSIAAATEDEVVSAINGAITSAIAANPGGAGFTITSLRAGSSASVEITGGSAAAALGLAISVADGTGNVADLSAVTAAEIKTIVEAAVSGVTVVNYSGSIRITAATTGSVGKLQVMSASTADDELGLDNIVHTGSTGAAAPALRIDARYDGTYAARVTVLVSPSTSGLSAEFNLSVLFNGAPVESWANLSMLDTSPRHVETIVNGRDGSIYIQAVDLNLSPGPSGALAERPANSPGSPAVAFGPLTGGNDGLVGLSELDFIGDESSQLGFRSFDLNDDVDLLICPEAATPAVHNAGLAYCSVTRNGDLFFIVDPPAGLGPQQINTYVVNTAAIKNTTEHGAVYWPRVKVLNPNISVYGNVPTITVPPSGHIAGMYARNDSATVGGVYQPPGGVDRGQLVGVLGFENELVLAERVRDLIVPNLINPITRIKGYPIAVDDVLTLKSDGSFPTIAERRGVTFIEKSIKNGLQFARMRNNDAVLRDEVDRTIDAFLLLQLRAGAFRSSNASEAFFVDVSDALNPPSEQFAGRLNCGVGLATQKPARFLILTFSQDTRAIDQELAAAS